MKELAILNELSARLRTISRRAGNYTDVGGSVYQGRIHYDDPDMRPFVTLALADEGTTVNQTDSRGQHILSTIIVAEGHIDTELGDLTAAYQLRQDIITALLTGDRNLGGLVKSCDLASSNVSATDSPQIATVQVSLAIIYYDNFTGV